MKDEEMDWTDILGTLIAGGIAVFLMMFFLGFLPLYALFKIVMVLK